jgi:hypothetical protein
MSRFNKKKRLKSILRIGGALYANTQKNRIEILNARRRLKYTQEQVPKNQALIPRIMVELKEGKPTFFGTAGFHWEYLGRVTFGIA